MNFVFMSTDHVHIPVANHEYVLKLFFGNAEALECNSDYSRFCVKSFVFGGSANLVKIFEHAGFLEDYAACSFRFAGSKSNFAAVLMQRFKHFAASFIRNILVDSGNKEFFAVFFNKFFAFFLIESIKSKSVAKGRSYITAKLLGIVFINSDGFEGIFNAARNAFIRVIKGAVKVKKNVFCHIILRNVMIKGVSEKLKRLFMRFILRF